MKNGQRSKITKTADGAVRFRLGPLWLIRCAPNRPIEFPGHPDIPGHSNVWMIVWRRRLPEWDRDSYERIIKPMSREERHRYFAAMFPRVKEPEVDWRGWQRDEHGNSIPNREELKPLGNREEAPAE